ncbi:cytochrome c-type biogenesis protein [Aquabacterium olei]|uniref:cytochrome c-type biogenesis protein n=1 Tax=Aquabacterium olei TaxID=1296669 RepID=UPI001FE84942|nr:cytochrome c-type biogenesis protein [Aquabacterium olei]
MRDRLVCTGLLALILNGIPGARAAEVPDGAAPHAAGSDTVLEDRVHALAAELRCLVCQNQSVADSHAPLAVQLREVVRSQVAAGASDQQVRDFMVQRYGAFVLYRPPLQAATLALWGGPVVMLLLALAGLALAVRARRLRDEDLAEATAAAPTHLEHEAGSLHPRRGRPA